MPLGIEDFPAASAENRDRGPVAVRDNIDNTVTVALSPFRPVWGNKINPGDPFRFTASAVNNGTIVLSGFTYHLKVLNRHVAELIVPLVGSMPQFRLVARATDNPSGATLAPGTPVAEMFLFPEAINEVKTLLPGETDSIALTGKAGPAVAAGLRSIQFNILTDMSVNDLWKDGSSQFVTESLALVGV